MLYSRLSKQKVNKILLCFCEDITAAAAKLVNVNQKTVNNYYDDIRGKILEESLKETPRDEGESKGGRNGFAGGGGAGRRRKRPFSGC
jgi:hypothetical protein